MSQAIDNPRRKNDPKAMRARILDAAYDLFQSRGYNGTSMQDITALAGVTGGAIHHHFATKKHLGLAVINENVAAAVEETWLAPVRSAESAKNGVLGVFGELSRQIDEQGSVRGCPVNNLTLELSYADPDFRGALRELFDDWRATIADKLRSEGQENADAIATLVIAAYSGAMAIAKVEQRGEPLRLCAKEMETLLLPAT